MHSPKIICMALLVLICFKPPISAQRLRDKQMVVLKHEEWVKVTEDTAETEEKVATGNTPPPPVFGGMAGWLDDVARSDAVGHEVGRIAGNRNRIEDANAKNNPDKDDKKDPVPEKKKKCGPAGPNDKDAKKISATIMGYVGLKGYKKSRSGSEIIIRVAFAKEPRVLYRGSIPDECMGEFKKKAEQAKNKLLEDLRNNHIILSAREVLQSLDLPDKWGNQPASTSRIKKKRTFTFLSASEQVTFTIPPFKFAK